MATYFQGNKLAPNGQHMEYVTLSDAEKYGEGLYAVRETFPDKLVLADEYNKVQEAEEVVVQEKVAEKLESAEDPVSLLRKKAKELGVNSWHLLSVPKLKIAIEEALAEQDKSVLDVSSGDSILEGGGNVSALPARGK